MAKILVSDKLAEEGVKILKDEGFEVDCKLKLAPEELKKIIGDYQALVVRSETKVTREIIESGRNLKVIGRAGVGVDNVDVPAATKKGIIVMNAPGGNTISTCEQTFALMLAAARNTPAACISVKNKQWERSKFKGIELYSKTLGIVGLGRIGKEVAKRARAFGMTVLIYDPFVTQELADLIGGKLTELHELLATSDFITVHTPLTPETKGIISRDQFALMKPKTVILNCARGGIIDEDALYEALKEKKIAMAALDVFVNEPPQGSKLLELENLIATPHLGASTEEAQVNVAIEVAHCISDALKGKAIRNAVNHVQLEPELYQIIEPYFNLAEKMGRFLSQLIEGRIKEITVSYLGGIASQKIDVVGSVFVRGLLSKQIGEEINYINALEIAKERAIKVEQVKISEEEEYVNSIRVKVTTDKGEHLLEGTLFANKAPRFVRMDSVPIEVAPSAHMIVIQNQDTPGVIGFLGTTLGSNNVNIAGMSLGRNKPRGVALTVLNVDSALDPKVTQQIQSNPSILSLKLITLA